jgi:periplasmic divalent cation tolerance protein
VTGAGVIQVMTTTDSREAADRIVGRLLESRLAACVQVIGPIASRYWWQGKIEQAEEWLCLAKTRSELYVAVEKAILKDHPYSNPEVVAVPVVMGSSTYLDWLMAETSA